MNPVFEHVDVALLACLFAFPTASHHKGRTGWNNNIFCFLTVVNFPAEQKSSGDLTLSDCDTPYYLSSFSCHPSLCLHRPYPPSPIPPLLSPLFS